MSKVLGCGAEEVPNETKDIKDMYIKHYTITLILFKFFYVEEYKKWIKIL